MNTPRGIERNVSPFVPFLDVAHILDAGAQAPHAESACTEIVTLHGNLHSISSFLAGICSLLIIDAGRV